MYREGKQCLVRWHEFCESIALSVQSFRCGEELFDVTLSCEGKSVRAHKLVLAASSQYFRKILKEFPCDHPTIILDEVPWNDLVSILHFMYCGQVIVDQDAVGSLLLTAASLGVVGLTQVMTAISYAKNADEEVEQDTAYDDERSKLRKDLKKKSVGLQESVSEIRFNKESRNSFFNIDEDFSNSSDNNFSFNNNNIDGELRLGSQSQEYHHCRSNTSTGKKISSVDVVVKPLSHLLPLKNKTHNTDDMKCSIKRTKDDTELPTCGESTKKLPLTSKQENLLPNHAGCIEENLGIHYPDAKKLCLSSSYLSSACNGELSPVDERYDLVEDQLTNGKFDENFQIYEENIDDCQSKSDSFPDLAEDSLIALKGLVVSATSSGPYKRKLAFHEPRPCPICRRMYRDAATLRTHMSIMHSEGREAFSCSCGSFFPTKYDMYQHRKNGHR